MARKEFNFEYEIDKLPTLSKEYMEDHFTTHYSIDDVNEELAAIKARQNAARPLFRMVTKVASLPTLRSDITINPLSSVKTTLFRRHNDVIDWLDEHRIMNQLIELIESLQMEQLCCDFLNEQLTKRNLKAYVRQNVMPASAQGHGDNNENIIFNANFKQQIFDLYKVFETKPFAIEIARLGIMKFGQIRDDIFSKLEEIRLDFWKQYEKATFGETDENIKQAILKELKDCCEMREKIFLMCNNLKLHKFTDELYNSVMTSIKTISHQLNQFNPDVIPPDSKFTNTRTIAMIEYRNLINKSLVDLLSDLIIYKLEKDTGDLKRRETIFDRHMEILLMEVPKPISVPVNSNKTQTAKKLSSQISYNEIDKAELKEKFSSWYYAMQNWVSKRNSERQVELETELQEG